MHRIRADLVVSSILGLLCFMFFARLFYPEPQLLVTPDYGRSDAWHFSFSTKFALGEALSQNTLPLWRSDIGDGFPLFAEGQTGALYLPNLLLFRFLPAVTAYNIALVGAVFMLGLGTYWLCRILKNSPLASGFVGLTVMFSGLTMTQLPHITLLQGMSMLPFVVSLSILVVTRGPYPFMGFLVFALSQQIMAGFPQATFLTCIVSALFVAWHSYQTKNIAGSLYVVLAMMLGLAGGAVQILPSWEFLKSSTDPKGFTPAMSSMYSMPFTHLLSFFNPFALGNPKMGTYPPFYAFDGSIFWENTPYVGLLPLILLAISIRFIKKSRILLLYWAIALGSLILAGGKYAPTYILFSAWPLTLFRVPSRFLWITILSIALIGGHVIDRVVRHNKAHWITLILSVGVLIHGISLERTWWSYHLIEPARLWLAPPAIARQIPAGRIFTVGHGALYNLAVTKKGWENGEPYRNLRQGMIPNSNMLWHVPQHSIYAGRYLRRPAITDTLMTDSMSADQYIATVSGTKFFDMFSIKNILSFVPLNAPEFIREKTISKEGDAELFLFSNPNALPRAYFSLEATSAATLNEAVSTLISPGFKPGTTVLLERHDITKQKQLSAFLSPTSSSPRTKTGEITWEQDSHTAIRLSVVSDQDALLVLTDTYYPGWVAHINGHPTPIMAANLSQRAVVVPAGKHIVTFAYRPLSLMWGTVITCAAFLITTILMIVLKISANSRTGKTALRHVFDHPGTRRR